MWLKIVLKAGHYIYNRGQLPRKSSTTGMSQAQYALKNTTKCCLGHSSSVANGEEIRKQDQNEEGNGYTGEEIELILHATSPPSINWQNFKKSIDLLKSCLYESFFALHVPESNQSGSEPLNSGCGL